MALLPPTSLDSVVAIGIRANNDVKYVGTGFTYGRFMGRKGDGKANYDTYLVTNRHVLKGTTSVFLRMNPKGSGSARPIEVATKDGGGKDLWFGAQSDKVDVAVLNLNFKAIDEAGLHTECFRSHLQVAHINTMKTRGVTEGDGVFVLGFPMGRIGENRSYAIVRHGIIARIRDALDGASDEFLIDSFVFPGNSGGPVLLQASPFAVANTQKQKSVYLIGIVVAYVPYHDVAISPQTGQTRVIFEENTGLAVVVPTDFIEEAIVRARVANGHPPGPAIGADVATDSTT